MSASSLTPGGAGGGTITASVTTPPPGNPSASTTSSANITAAIGESHPERRCKAKLILSTVTSTITTSPPGFSVETTSRSDWTENTWFSTTGPDGLPTELPVIAKCPDCGSDKYIMWNIPPIPNVSFRIPGFPHPFHFPCLFFCSSASISGSTPPISEPDYNNDSSSRDRSTSLSSTSGRSQSVASTTATSQVSSSVASTTASSSSSSSTSSSLPTFTYYIITPNPSASADIINAFTERLRDETDANTLRVGGVPAIDYVNHWTQFLNSTQVAQYRASPAVSLVTQLYIVSTLTRTRSLGLEFQMRHSTSSRI